MQHLIVPVDDSSDSWRAVDTALALARRWGSDIRITEVAFDPVTTGPTQERLDRIVAERGPFDVEVTTEVRLTGGSVADELTASVGERPDSLIVMASHGKGRSAGLLGSVTEEVVRQAFGPIILVGPQARLDDFSGPIVVSVDGSKESELALPLAAAWSTQLRSAPWIVNVATQNTAGAERSVDTFDTAYPARLAKELAAISGQPVEFDELHDPHAERAVPGYATRHGASLIIATSHGRSGLSRVVMGSVSAGFVRNATCPVAVIRLPHPSGADNHPRWSY